MIPLICGIQSSQTRRDRKQNGGYQGIGGGGNGELVLNGYRVPVWEDEKILKMDGGDGCKTM